MSLESPNNVLIFATRSLPDNEAERLREAGLKLEQKDFILVENSYDSESFRHQLRHSESQARIFTSKNAVRSLRQLLADSDFKIPNKKTFTVGIKATEMLADLGIKTTVRSDNAIILAQIIARNADVREVDFFCGDKALNDLPEYLESKNIKVNKEIVYHTELTHDVVDTEKFNGLIFLSPTAAFSFFKKNKIDPKIPAFCIGATTAEAVRLRCENPRIIADEPSISGVVTKIIDQFRNKAQ